MEQSGMNKYIAVEIGGTKQQLAAGTKDGVIEKRRTVKLGNTACGEDIRQWIKTNVEELIQEEKPAAIGCGFGGVLEFEEGKSLGSMQVEGWKDFKLKEWLEEEFHLPVVLLNDTVAGGFGELYAGAGKGSRRFFYTNLGTGIGGGFYLDGKSRDCFGRGGSYLGNTWVPDWRSDKLGAVTKAEYICSGMNIEKRLNQPGYIPSNSFLAEKQGEVTCVDLAEGVRQKDAFCMGQLDRTAETFAIALANMMALVAPDRIVIGGGVAKMGEILFSRIREYTQKYAFVANQERYEIKESQLLDDAVLVGSLLAAGNLGQLW